ncbi:MAG: hypothetical protein RBT69_01425 [Spirochaetia bacterium]|nr:hypothetical protein [Spirochaetia bacterium]
MKKKRKKISLLFFLIIYIFLAPEYENNSIKFSPVRVVNALKPVKGEADKDSLIPFRLGQVFGYFDRNGKASIVDNVFYNIAQNKHYFINYTAVTENLVVNKNDGRFVSNIKTSGYPFFIKERLFVISANSKMISEWSIEGENIFSYENESEIISSDANTDTFIAGFIDGTVIVSDKDKKIEKLMKPELSRINAVYGLAISGDSELLAMITGIDPQYMIIMKKKHNQYSRIYTYQFSNNLRSSRYITFSDDDRYLFFESENIFYCYDFISKNLVSTPLEGRITAIHFIPESGFSAVKTENQAGQSYFYLIYPDSRIMYKKKIESDNVYMNSSDGRFYFGTGSYIYTLDMLDD